MSEEKPEINKQQLEENIRVADRWRQAIRRGKFDGDDVVAIAQILGFLDTEYAKSVAEYESQLAVHPNWGKPSDVPVKGPNA